MTFIFLLQAYDWYSGDCDVISKIVVFLNKLASAQVSFLEMIFTGIVRKMIPSNFATKDYF